MYSGSTVVSGGEAIADITLPFDISRFPEDVVGRNELILEVSDADPASKLRSDTLTTPFIASAASGSSGLRENTQSVSAITAKLSNFQSGTAVTKNLKLVNEQKLTEADLLKMGLASEEVQSFIGSGAASDSDAAKFCELVFSSISDIDACQKNPASQLQFNVKKPTDGLFESTTEVSTHLYSLNASASAGCKS